MSVLMDYHVYSMLYMFTSYKLVIYYIIYYITILQYSFKWLKFGYGFGDKDELFDQRKVYNILHNN